MKKFCLIVLLLAVFIGCDQNRKMLTPVMTGDSTPEVVKTPTAPAEEVIPAISFDNVFDLEVGKKYKISPVEVWEIDAGIDSLITTIFWGNVTLFNPIQLRKNFSVGDPKVVAEFQMAPQVYSQTLEEEAVIACKFSDGIVECDEIVIEIVRKIAQSEEVSSGRRLAGAFDYMWIHYEAVAIENLTHPERKFEYE